MNDWHSLIGTRRWRRHIRLAACESQRRDSYSLNEIPRLSYIGILTHATFYELSTLYACDKEGGGGIDRVSGSSRALPRGWLAFTTITCVVVPRILGSKLAISITETRIPRVRFFFFLFFPSFYSCTFSPRFADVLIIASIVFAYSTCGTRNEEFRTRGSCLDTRRLMPFNYF